MPRSGCSALHGVIPIKKKKDPTRYMGQGGRWFLDDFDGYDLYASTVLDICKTSLMLQSGHKSKYIDFIFILFFSILNTNVSKTIWL